MKYVLVYLAAIVAANLLVAQFGPAATIWNAFLFIGLDSTCRDALHDRWQHKYLWPKMAALIAAGSLLSCLLNRNAGMIALASFISFAAASTVDTLVYHRMRNHPWLVKVNSSNAVSAAVDSVVFPTVAFGSFLPWIVAGQFVAKLCGGFIWSIGLGKHK